MGEAVEKWVIQFRFWFQSVWFHVACAISRVFWFESVILLLACFIWMAHSYQNVYANGMECYFDCKWADCLLCILWDFFAASHSNQSLASYDIIHSDIFFFGQLFAEVVQANMIVFFPIECISSAFYFATCSITTLNDSKSLKNYHNCFISSRQIYEGESILKRTIHLYNCDTWARTNSYKIVRKWTTHWELYVRVSHAY